MRIVSFLTTLALAATTAHAANNKLINYCDFPVYYRQVDGNGTVPAPVKLESKASTTEAQFFHVSGTSIKFTKTPNGIYESKPTLQFAYTYKAGESIYYSLGTDYGYDFYGQKITLGGNGAPWIIWDNVPGPVHTAAYVWGEVDLELTLCA